MENFGFAAKLNFTEKHLISVENIFVKKKHPSPQSIYFNLDVLMQNPMGNIHGALQAPLLFHRLGSVAKHHFLMMHLLPSSRGIPRK